MAKAVLFLRSALLGVEKRRIDRTTLSLLLKRKQDFSISYKNGEEVKENKNNGQTGWFNFIAVDTAVLYLYFDLFIGLL